MAVVITKSTVITNRDATPAVINDGRLAKGGVISAIGSVAVGAADSATSKFILATVPSTAMIRQILASCPAGMTTLAGDVGVYRATVDGGAVVDVDLFGSAVSFATVLNNSDITDESTNYSTDKQEQPLWQAAGLTTDPGTPLDIVITVTTANTGVAGRVGLKVNYVDNGN